MTVLRANLIRKAGVIRSTLNGDVPAMSSDHAAADTSNSQQVDKERESTAP